jgi:hypothetical protein
MHFVMRCIVRAPQGQVFWGFLQSIPVAADAFFCGVQQLHGWAFFLLNEFHLMLTHTFLLQCRDFCSFFYLISLVLEGAVSRHIILAM